MFLVRIVCFIRQFINLLYNYFKTESCEPFIKTGSFEISHKSFPDCIENIIELKNQS